MARTTTTPAPAPATTPGAITLPDASEWASFEVKPQALHSTEPHGRVIGLDYDAWAVVAEPITAKKEWLAARAKKLEEKGFRELVGQELVVYGWNVGARVWVMPRHLYEQRRQVRDQNLVDKVRTGLYPESALSVGLTRAARK
jgi:hypothetical protein